MNTTIVTNYSSPKETAAVESLISRFGTSLRIVTPLSIAGGTIWQVPDSDKTTVEWTKRFLRVFLTESADILIKIDPDTVIKTLPDMPPKCDVAGDFRKTNIGWVWFGACQYYTRNAVERILSDPLYVGKCVYQDVELAESIKRMGLKAYNMPNVDGWSAPDSTANVTHKGRHPIPKRLGGFITLV